MGTREDQSVETLRGGLIVVLVAYHSAGDMIPPGENAPYSVYPHLAFCVDAVIMPMFAVLSGFVYAIRPVAAGFVAKFVTRKIERILLPFFAAVTLSYLLGLLVAGHVEGEALRNIWRAYLLSYEPFWFLQSLFLIFLVVAGLDRFGLMAGPVRWAICLVAALLVRWATPPTGLFDFFSIWGAFYLLPAFLLGYGLKRYPARLRHPALLAAAAIIAVVTLTGLQLAWFGHLDESVKRTGRLGTWAGLSVSFLLFHFRGTLPLLPTFGLYSYAIYLYHGIAVALGKRGYDLIDLQTEHLLFLAKLVVGLTLPIVGERVLRRSGLLSRVFLGLRLPRKEK